MKQASALIKSRASKAKNHKWANCERFSLGHDPASLSLMPEEDKAKFLAARSERRERPLAPIGVWRSNSFGKSQEELIYESAQRLIRAGRVSTVDEAVERATAAVRTSWHHQIGNEVIVEVQK